MAQPKPGSFVHIELASTDPTRTRRFLEDVFDWKFQEMPEMQYATFEAPGGPGGGLMAPAENQPPGVLNYLLSTDIESDLRKIEAAGGRVLRPRTEIPTVGWWAMFQEPTGIVLALFQGSGIVPQREQRPRRRARTSARARTSGRARTSRGGKRSRGGRKGRRGR